MGAGEAWKNEREARGMSLEEASSALRVSRRYLKDIEEGNYSGWPERVFSSGYIRAYAKLLSQDPEPVLSEYYNQLGQHTVEQPAPHVKPEWLERERQRGSRRNTYALAAAVVLLIGMVLAWYGTRTATRPLPVQSQAVPVPSPAPAPVDNAATAAQPGVDNAATAAKPGVDNVAVQQAGAPAVPQGSVASIGGVGPVKSPYQLFIEASEMTWMMYTMDNDAPVDVMLYPGDKISIQARSKILLKLGNAGGVVGTLNGKLLPPFGSRGQVKEIRLGE
ncbi:MAG TPA: RodZ domain-containing protein [Candidatus Deferrimicrobiaceae bacterium]|jgi:cytoskeletal protein RodZ